MDLSQGPVISCPSVEVCWYSFWILHCLQDKRLIPGAGATEIELAKKLTSYGEVCRYHINSSAPDSDKRVSLCFAIFFVFTASPVDNLHEHFSLCSPARVWSSMLLKSLLKPLRLYPAHWLRTLVWRRASSSLKCTLRIMRATKTWASTLRCVFYIYTLWLLRHVRNGEIKSPGWHLKMQK